MQNINKFLSVLVMVFLTSVVLGQKKATYQLVKEESGLAFFSKWVELKGVNAGKQALFIKVTNKTDKPVSYSVGVEVFVDNILVEEASETEYCIRPKKTNQGKLNGIYFVSEKVKKEDLESGKTVVELTGLKTSPAESCPGKKKS